MGRNPTEKKIRKVKWKPEEFAELTPHLQSLIRKIKKPKRLFATKVQLPTEHVMKVLEKKSR